MKVGVVLIDKIKGFEYVYKLVTYSTIANWFWVETLFELKCMTHCLKPNLYENLTWSEP